MFKNNYMNKLLIYSIFLLLLSIKNSYAYIDPVSISFLFKAIISGIAACVVFIKRIREKILSVFGFSKKDNEKLDDNRK